ncbi:NAD-dependent epimerase/dehydratase family protein [Paracoccus sp. Z118]|uniref:NAD-dependent epimerase/dehydratase family protein n=1 Tax=Paracoccus sp. Z118 TaxID=2851017 RepID=UPI001C2CC269|nr:NAD-dependent epimerase/dehydratase family protein [Paracoccus sp. Z118]MBV0891625.1 NAD-dependent epimerase/dehydratase family protein [Paracoccus sp. Z118]
MIPASTERIALVTGGGGFIGQSLVRRLLAEGWTVRNLDFVAGRIDHPRLSHWAGSFLQRELLTEALVAVDTVFHLAATKFPREADRDPLADAQENVTGTVMLLDRAIEAETRRLIFASSGGTVYGPPERLPVDEDHPTRPMSAYGVSKLACEHYLRLYDGRGRRPLSTLSLRLANPYGPRQNIDKAHGALTTFCHRAAQRRPITIWGDGSVERDFVHIDDVSRALVRAADAGAHGTQINIGAGKGTTLNDILALIEQVQGRRPEVIFEPGRAFDVPRSVLCSNRARELLGWQAETPLEQGVAELLAAFAPTEPALERG